MGIFSKLWKSITKPLKQLMSWLVPTPDTTINGFTVEKHGSDHPIPVVYGTRKIAGVKVHKYVTDATGGAKNEFLHLIIVFCEGPIEAISELFFDGVSEHDSRWNKSGGGKWFTVQRRLGTDEQTALSTGIPNWNQAHRLQGLAYIHLRLQMDERQSIWRGEPEVQALIAGRKVYDPRSNKTVYSENLPLQLLDYLTHPRYGKALPLSRLNVESFTDAADWADQLISSSVEINGVQEQVTHARITGNFTVDTAAPVFNNVREMLSGMRGQLPIGAGLLRLLPEKEGTPQFYFGHTQSQRENYALITSAMKSRGGRKNNRFNRVIVRFANKVTDYEKDEVHYPAAGSALALEWLAEDNGVLLEKSFEFSTITNKAEAYQMAEIICKRSRNLLEVSFSASPPSIVVEPGDIVAISDDTRGWHEKPFRVEQCKMDESGDVEFEFVEHQNAIYPWAGVHYSERVGGTNLGNPTAIAAPTDVVIEPDLTGVTGGLVMWSALSDAFVRSFLVQLWRRDTKVLEQSTTSKRFSLPLLGLDEYQLNVYAVSTLNTLSTPASYSFTVAVPVPPTSIELVPSHSSIAVIPKLSGIGLGTEFEFAILTQSNFRGRGASMVLSGLLPNTEYEIFVRSVSSFGVSDWVSVSARTQSDPQPFVDWLGDAIIDSLSPSILEEAAQQASQFIDERLAELPTHEDVTSIVDDALDSVDVENPYIRIADTIASVVDNYETEKHVKNEKIERKSEMNQLAVAIELEAETRTAAITLVQEALVDEIEARALQAFELQSEIEREGQVRSSAISQLNQTLATEEQTRAQQFNQLQSALVLEGETRSSAVNQLTETLSTETQTRAQQVNQLQSSIEEEGQSRSSAISQLNQTLATEAQTRAQQFNQLQSALVLEGETRSSAVNQLTETLSTEIQTRAQQVIELQASQSTALQRLSAVEHGVDGVSEALETVAGRVHHAQSGLSATFTLASQAKSSADGAVSALSGLQTRVAGAEGALSSAALQLSSHSDALGDLSSRAYLGVSASTSGTVRVNGLLIDGQSNSMEFMTSSVRFVDQAGSAQFYWDASTGRFVYKGALIANSLSSPQIHGGDISGAVLRGGYLIIGEGEGPECVRIIGAPFGSNGQLIDWFGPKHQSFYDWNTNKVNLQALGEINPADAYFFLDATGGGFIRGQFFQGALFESKSAAGTTTATIHGHVSSGKLVKIDLSAVYSAVVSGNFDGIDLDMSVVIRRNSQIVDTVTANIRGLYIERSDRTAFTMNLSQFVVDERTVSETRNYSATCTITVPQGVTLTHTRTPTQKILISTFENLL